MRAVLYSPGYGAGWVSWHHGSREQKAFMLEYAPFIAALRGDVAGEATPEAIKAASDALAELHAGHRGWTRETAVEAFRRDWHYEQIPNGLLTLVPQFLREWAEKFPGVDAPYLGGLRDLAIEEVGDDEQVKVEEYDGNERVVRRGEDAEEWV